MLVRRYEMPWRRAYEVYAGAAWGLALVFFMFAGVSFLMNASPSVRGS